MFSHSMNGIYCKKQNRKSRIKYAYVSELHVKIYLVLFLNRIYLALNGTSLKASIVTYLPVDSQHLAQDLH